ncbi:MAG: hypothetical protein IPL31_16135 [Saprospiraceae bacterium]|nr:hypothetical protein [Saprospiraceae bacterium]
MNTISKLKCLVFILVFVLIHSKQAQSQNVINLNWNVEEDANIEVYISDSFSIKLTKIKEKDSLDIKVGGWTSNRQPVSSNAQILISNKEIQFGSVKRILKQEDKVEFFLVRTLKLYKIEFKIGTESTDPRSPGLVSPESSIYNDALNLYKSTSTVNSKKILAKYELHKLNITTNNFLREFISLYEEAGTESESPINRSSKSESGLGGLDVTLYADALAKFLVKRTKEELTINFFQKFKETIESNDYRDFQSLFQHTYGTLLVIGTEIYNYQMYLSTLRQNFEKDLSLLPDNVTKIIDNHRPFFDQYPQLETSLNLSSAFSIAIRDGTHPAQFLENLDNFQLRGLDPTLTGLIQTLKLFSVSLKNNDAVGKRYWIDSKELLPLVRDIKFLKIFLGLFLQDVKRAQITIAGIAVDSMLNQVGEQYNLYAPIYQTFLKNLTGTTDRLNRILENSKITTSPEDKLENVLSYFDVCMQLMDNIAKIPKLLPANISADIFNPDALKKINHYIDISRNSIQLISHINNRKYSSAISNLTSLYDLIFLENESKLDFEINKKLRNKLLKYGNFMAAMSEAENSDQAAEIIETFALPAGSARIKRETSCNIALNAYLGPFIGTERNIRVNDTFEFVWGLTAPVGISFSAGKLGKNEGKKGGKSLSLFFPIIDIGALTAFRFRDNESSIPKITFAEIFSPGAFLSFGFGKTPISVNAGYQIAPLLRTVGPENNISKLDYYGRVSFSVLVDIPLMNFYTSDN